MSVGVESRRSASEGAAWSASGPGDDRPVLLLAETGFIIRNLLLGTFARAVAARRPLVVSVPRPDDPGLIPIARDLDARLAGFPKDTSPLPRGRLQKLKSFDILMYRFKEAQKGTKGLEIQSRLYESSHSTLGRTARRTAVGLGKFVNSAGLMPRFEDAYLKKVAALEVTDRWRRLLAEHRPTVVVSTMLTHSILGRWSTDLPAVLAAREAGIPVGTLVQSWDNLSSKTSLLPPWLDRVWTWGPAMTEELLQLNPRLRLAQTRVVGCPQFDFHLLPELEESRESFRARWGLDPARKLIVIGTGTRTWLPNEPHTVLEIVRALSKTRPDAQVLLRLHPKDDGQRWADSRAELDALGVVFQMTSPEIHMDDGGFIPPKEFFREQVNTLRHADVVINTASTFTIDAAILDRPVLSLGFDTVPDPKFPEGRALAYNGSTHFGVIVETGGVRVVRSPDECLATVADYLDDPARDREGRRRIVERVTGGSIGSAGETLAADVLTLAEQGASTRR